MKAAAIAHSEEKKGNGTDIFFDPPRIYSASDFQEYALSLSRPDIQEFIITFDAHLQELREQHQKDVVNEAIDGLLESL